MASKQNSSSCPSWSKSLGPPTNPIMAKVTLNCRLRIRSQRSHSSLSMKTNFDPSSPTSRGKALTSSPKCSRITLKRVLQRHRHSSILGLRNTRSPRCQASGHLLLNHNPDPFRPPSLFLIMCRNTSHLSMLSGTQIPTLRRYKCPLLRRYFPPLRKPSTEMLIQWIKRAPLIINLLRVGSPP